MTCATFGMSHQRYIVRSEKNKPKGEKGTRLDKTVDSDEPVQPPK